MKHPYDSPSAGRSPQARALRGWVGLIGAALLLGACSSVDFRPDTLVAPRPFPALRLAVLSDIHVYDPALGTGTPAWEEYLKHDRKLLAQSLESFQQALRDIAAQRPDLLLISGDLTKDGELVCHQAVARELQAIKAQGVAVMVIPGNHDVRNFAASRFDADGRKPVENVDAGAFAAIYQDFGYGAAILRDPGSLSYLAPAAPGLYVLGIDSTRQAENQAGKHPITGGRIDQGRADFIRRALARAAQDQVAVIAMMHHGLAEHYERQAEFFPEYVVEDNRAVARLLADGGVRLVFTGHYHANDITRMVADRVDGRELPIWDIETGSLATWPCPWRLVSLNGHEASFSSHRVDQLPSFDGSAHGGLSFGAYARAFTGNGLTGLAVGTMVGLGMSRGEAEGLAPQITAAFMAHYQGDEQAPANPKLQGTQLSFMGGLVVASKGPLVELLWRDLAPADNDLVIDTAP